MKGVKFLWIAILALGLFTASQAFAQPGMPCPGMMDGYYGGPQGPCGPGFHHPPMPPQQNITAEQRQKYYAIRDEFAPKFQSLRDQLFVKVNVLQALKKAAQPDVARVEAVCQEILKLRAAKRDLQMAFDKKIATECGIKKPAKPIPGVDVPPRPFHGPHHPMHMPH
ncbi:MAG: periplasmic heavy metal sensor [Desulfovibrionaceae bacterium]|nr:periplasmic heavy metal sensor [Desulfovibrionaceae bacterium]